MRYIAVVGILSFSAMAAQADMFHVGNGSIDGSLCVGNACITDEPFIGIGLRVKTVLPYIEFEDTSGSTFPSNDWQVVVNDSFALGTGGENYFAVRDVTGGNSIFRLQAGAPENSIYVAGNGQIGMGTVMPQEEIHIAGTTSPGIRLESNATDSWDIKTNSTFWWVQKNDAEGSETPFVLRNGAPNNSFWMVESGNIGLGTPSPDGKLHTQGDGVQLVYFESSDGGPVQVRFRTDSENRRFLAVNNANEVQSQIIVGDDEINFTGATDSGTNLWLSISAAGIVSQGPTCNPGPCDATFDPAAFDVPSIEEHAAYMWESQHLWAVGPTTSDQPINLTEKLGGVIHELEVAHIYIEELHKELATLSARLEKVEND